MKRAVVVAVLLLNACSGGGESSTFAASKNHIDGQCPAPQPELLNAGLCVCKTFDVVGDLHLDPLKAGEPSRGGVNGVTHLVGTPDIIGDFVAYEGFDGVGEASVSGTLSTHTDLSGVGTLQVGKDLIVGGNLSGVGTLQVGGNLRVAGKTSTTGDAKYGGIAEYLEVPLPCACGDDQILDIAAKVAEAKAKAGYGADQAAPTMETVGTTQVTLTSGSYYFGAISSVGDWAWDIEGGVEIFVDGDLAQVGSQNIHLAKGATLDLYVSGKVETVGDTDFGSEAGAFRLFIGGKDPVGLSVGTQNFKGSIYAPRARLEYVGDTVIEGTLFAGSVDGVGTLTIHQAGPVATDPSLCQPPSSGAGGGDGAGGSGGSNGADGGSETDAGTALIN
jgi:hypothetical protein